MHKLYDVTCTIISSDIAPDIFADGSIFTEEEPSTQVDTFNTFQDFFDAVSSHKYPWSIPGSNYTYGTSMFGKPFVTVYGLRFDYNITERNFKAPVLIQTTCKECSTKDNSFDFFKRNLSMDNFKIFLQEQFDANTSSPSPTLNTLTEKLLND